MTKQTETPETPETPEARPLNLFQRLNEVRKQADYLKKDTTVQGYKAVTHDAVTAFVRPHLIKHGVMILPNLNGHRVSDTGTQTSNGVPIIRYEAEYLVMFINVDNPEDRIAIEISAHANDHGDKAPGKCLSYCVKYAILKVLNIETGEEEEARIQPHAVEPDAEGKAILEKCASIGALAKAWNDLTKQQRLTLNEVKEACKKRIEEADSE